VIFQKVLEYWTQVVVEPQQKIQGMWEECLKNWENINEKMRDIWLPEFGIHENFVYLHDIVEQLDENDHKFEVDVLQIMTLERGHLRKFADGSIRASLVLCTYVVHFKFMCCLHIVV
jgi:hypothetical protein